jgi:hypothetical protein
LVAERSEQPSRPSTEDCRDECSDCNGCDGVSPRCNFVGLSAPWNAADRERGDQHAAERGSGRVVRRKALPANAAAKEPALSENQSAWSGSSKSFAGRRAPWATSRNVTCVRMRRDFNTLTKSVGSLDGVRARTNRENPPGTKWRSFPRDCCDRTLFPLGRRNRAEAPRRSVRASPHLDRPFSRHQPCRPRKQNPEVDEPPRGER